MENRYSELLKSITEKKGGPIDVALLSRIDPDDPNWQHLIQRVSDDTLDVLMNVANGGGLPFAKVQHFVKREQHRRNQQSK